MEGDLDTLDLDTLAPWSKSEIVADGWDDQRIFQYLTQEYGLKAAEAISEMNLFLPWLLWCIREGDRLLLAPPRMNRWRDQIKWRRNGQTVEIIIFSAPSVKPILFRALPKDVRARWDEATEPPAGDPQRSVPSNEGGRPTDEKLVLAEAERQIRDKDPLPASKAAWARRLNRWLEKQSDAIRDGHGKVTKGETICGWTEITRLWREYTAALSKK